MQTNGQYCGMVGNGCGGLMDCGGCPNGQACGGAGLPGVCGAATDSGACTPTQCTNANGQYCGVVGNGCGGALDCGGGPGGQSWRRGGAAGRAGGPAAPRG